MVWALFDQVIGLSFLKNSLAPVFTLSTIIPTEPLTLSPKSNPSSLSGLCNVLQTPNIWPDPDPDPTQKLRHVSAESEAPMQLRGRVDWPTRPSELRRRQDQAGPRRPVVELRGATIQDDSTQLCCAELHRDQVPAPRRDPRLAANLGRERRRRRRHAERVRDLAENPAIFV